MIILCKKRFYSKTKS